MRNNAFLKLQSTAWRLFIFPPLDGTDGERLELCCNAWHLAIILSQMTQPVANAWGDAVPHAFGTVKIGVAGVSSCLMDIS